MSSPIPTVCRFQKASPLIRGMLLFCIVSAAWRGPVPILHAHSLDIQTIATSPDLCEHAGRFHARELDTGYESWHWHLVMPMQPGHDHEEDSSTCVCDVMCSAASSTGAALDVDGAESGLQWQLPASNCCERSVAEYRDYRGSGSFLTTYSHSRALLSLISVARC